MGDIIPLTGAHLPIGVADEETIALLRGLLAKAERGDLIGIGVYWVEYQNDVLCSIAPGCARAALMVAGASLLYDETKKSWYK